MFLEYSKDFFIFVSLISFLDFANLNIISYYIYSQLVYLKVSGCSQALYNGVIFLIF